MVDWKSDVEMSAAKYTEYKAPLGAYRKQTSAREALLVLMPQGAVLRV